MIICLCTGCSESDVRKCIANGAKSLELIEDACQAGSCCESCHPELISLLAEQKACAINPPLGADDDEEKL